MSATSLVQVKRRRIQDMHMRPPGMGDWGGAVTELIAGGELEKLNSAVRALLDKLIAAINSRAEIVQGYREAKALFADAQAKYGPPMMSVGYAEIPNQSVLPAFMAFGTAAKGVQVFAREVQTLGFLDRVFTQVSAALTRAGASNDANSIDQALAQLRRFTMETDNLFFSLAPEYNETKQKILAQAKPQWAALGVAANAYDDPKWMAGYIRAANIVVPIDDQPEPPAAVAEAGLGALPVLGAMLIWVIGIVVAGLVISSAISRILPDTNSKARTAEALLLKYQEQKAREAAEMRAAGYSEEQIKKRMDTIDDEKKRDLDKIPNPPSIMGWVVGGLAAAVVGYFGLKWAGVL